MRANPKSPGECALPFALSIAIFNIAEFHPTASPILEDSWLNGFYFVVRKKARNPKNLPSLVGRGVGGEGWGEGLGEKGWGLGVGGEGRGEGLGVRGGVRGWGRRVGDWGLGVGDWG
ncbi:MAG: hypothetical protein DCC52_03160 [Chloroflexi bacterium]|nr:MAG: hypothetical protein DCC52_03160 [Chloroflexota bacterium]